MTENYQKQWKVKSHSNPNKEYVVSLKVDGSYICSCPHFIYRRKGDCKHIMDAKDGLCDDIQSEFFIVPSIVQQATQITVDTFHVPMIPFNRDGAWLLYTIVFDLLQYGVPWRIIKEYYDHLIRAPRQDIVDYVLANGRHIYGDWVDNPDGVGGHFVGYKTVPVN